MRRWLTLVVDHPDWVRSCSACEEFVIGPTGLSHTDPNGRKVRRLEMVGELAKPPCGYCPKIPPGSPPLPDSGRDLDAPAWVQVLRWFFEGQATAFDPAELTPTARELAAVVAAFLATRDAAEALARAGRKAVPRPARAVLLHLAAG